MVHTPDKQVVRIRLGGLDCRSKERLLESKLAVVPGVSAASIGDGHILTVLIDRRSVDTDGLVTAIVAAGLVPEELVATAVPSSFEGGSDVR